jgi:hypothetical protein
MSQSPVTRRPLKAKKDLDEDIISEKFTFLIKNWSQQKERCGLETTSECCLCEIDWLVTFKGSDFHSEYASIFITNLSARSITASYFFTIKNEVTSKDVTFSDPEESVTFDPDGGGDDTWGSDEFLLSSNLLDDSYGFVIEDSIEIEIEVQICGIVKSSATVLSQAIENSIGMLRNFVHDIDVHIISNSSISVTYLLTKRISNCLSLTSIILRG